MHSRRLPAAFFLSLLAVAMLHPLPARCQPVLATLFVRGAQPGAYAALR